MNIIEINTLPNGAHRNQSGGSVLPDGWAVIPDGMEMQNFPFGEVVVEDVAGVPTVTAWVAGIVPEPEEETTEPTDTDVLNILLGVDE